MDKTRLFNFKLVVHAPTKKEAIEYVERYLGEGLRGLYKDTHEGKEMKDLHELLFIEDILSKTGW